MAQLISDNVPGAIDAFGRGEFVMVMDRLDRENECDLVLAGRFCTPEKMAFMIKWSTGIVCVVTDQERLEKAGLHPAAPLGNTDKNGTNFYVSTDFLPRTTTGVSAKDRCETVLAFCDSDGIVASDFSKPGHIFPLCARPNGLRERDGHTESAYDLCRLANLETVSIIGEMMHDDGTMMRLSDSRAFAKEHRIHLITVPQLKAYAERHLGEVQIPDHIRSSVLFQSACKIKVEGVDEACSLSVFRVPGKAIEIVALVRGDLRGKSKVPLRIHSECFTGDILRSMRCDCGSQLTTFITKVMGRSREACLLYIKGHEGRGIGLANKVRCYKLQDEENLDTVDANRKLGFEDDLRSFAECREVINMLGICSVDLYTNNPDKVNSLGTHLVNKVEAMPSLPNGVNNEYLIAKHQRFKHQTVIDTMQWNKLQFNSPTIPELTLQSQIKVAVVSATWNDEYVSDVAEACLAELKANQALVESIKVPGAMDLIAGARTAAKRCGDLGAIIAIGVLIQGETDLYHNNCNALANGFASLNAKEGMPPVISGLLMYKTEAQASSRLESEESRKLGISWAKSAISMARI